MMHAGAKVAVAGSTGRVGRNVVDVLRARGFEVVPMSRAEGVDLVTGKGLAEAVAGTSCIVHVASGPSPEQEQATEFFTASARNLQDAGQRAGVSHIVAVSIIGCDKFSAGYNVAKVAQERTLQAGPIPVRILRAAQFHEFVAQMVEWGTQGGVCYLPRMRTQLVAARNVAEELVDLATQPAAGTDSKPVPEIAGPRAENLADVAKLLSARRGGPTQVEEVSDPADPDRDLFASGALLPGPHATLAGPTFQQWLESTPDA